MIINFDIISNFYALWKIISTKKKKHFFALMFLSVVVSFFELLNIGALFPFLTVLSNPDSLFKNNYFKSTLSDLNIHTSSELMLLVTVIFGCTVLCVSLMRSFLFWANAKFALNTCAELGSDIYLRTILQPYQVHIEQNSSEIINGVLSQTNAIIYDVILPLMTLISSMILAFFIMAALFFYYPLISVSIFFMIGAVYACIVYATRKKLKTISKTLANESTNLIRTVQEGLGGIRDIILDGSQMTYWSFFQASNLPLRNVQASIAFIGNGPRYLVEGLAMLVIAIFSFFLVRNSHLDSTYTLPFLGVMALGAQRLLPLFQQSFSSWTLIRGGQDTLVKVLSLLNQSFVLPPLSPVKLDFKKAINFNNVCFRHYASSPYILNNISLTITKGSRIGIIGKTGSGKSTLTDLFMGLLLPSSGHIEVDGVTINSENTSSWQRNIAHVPQSIYLSDATVVENIAFGVPLDMINMVGVRLAAEQAQLSSFIESLPEGYETQVGERGIRLSGGQRQRIGIARALYKNANVIIFDEATSALDNQTESEILSTIENLDKNITILMVAHRLSTLKNCDAIIEVSNGNIQNFEIN
jgi:ABC-type multidrug transport system fused ATPase/permease subunit